MNFNRLPIKGTASRADAAIPRTQRFAVLGTDKSPSIDPNGNIPWIIIIIIVVVVVVVVVVIVIVIVVVVVSLY